MKVLITDGNQRSALATTRSFGSKKFTTWCGEYFFPFLSSMSKYCNKAFLYSNPFNSSKDFIYQLKMYAKECFILPMTDVTLSEVLKNKKIFLEQGSLIPFGNYEQFEIASNKIKVFKISQRLNISIPKTVFIYPFMKEKEIISQAEYIGFPLVIKPFKSWIKKDNKWKAFSVKYAFNLYDLKKYISLYKDIPFMIQEKIYGHGIGIFLLVKKGDILTYFSHKRIREKPPTGGVSTVCESILPPKTAFEDAKRLVREIGLTGPVMIEFKNDIKDGVPKLMEINYRFWGSLSLSIECGIDFPYLTYLLATNQRVKFYPYKIGKKLRWILGDLDHVLITLKQRRVSVKHKWKVIKQFILDFFNQSIYTDVFRLDDLCPFILEFLMYMRSILKSIC